MNAKNIASEIKDILKNVSFPAHKNEVVDQAQQQGASGKAVGALQQLPSEQFGSVEELLSKLPMSEIAGEISKWL